MIMDFIKGKIDDIVEKIKKDPKMLEKFQKEPVKTVEGLIGMDLPDDQIMKIVDAVKAKLNLDKVGDLLGGLGGLFGKK